MSLVLNIMAIGLIATTLFAEAKERVYVVETEVVTQQKFDLTQRFIGTMTAENFSVLRAKSNSTIASIHVKAEQSVKKGQLLVSLNNSSTKSSLDIAVKMYESLKKEVERLKELKRSNDITKAHLEKVKRDFLNASMTVESNKKVMEETEIRAPFDGIVGVPKVVIGESVKPETPIISIRKGSFIYTFLIPASRIRDIAVGQKIVVNNEESTISELENTIDPLTRTAFARARFPLCRTCIIGESVFADLTIANKEKAILIDRNAVFYDKGKPYVVVVKANENEETKAEIRGVILGHEQDERVEILGDTLRHGDRIVKTDPKRIKPDSLLKVLP